MKFDIQAMLEQAQRMQSEVEKMKSEIAKKIVSADSGGGLVRVEMTGGYEIISIKISPEIINPEDMEMLEDLIIAAVNKANEAAQIMVQEDMKKITGMLPNIPGLNLPM